MNHISGFRDGEDMITGRSQPSSDPTSVFRLKSMAADDSWGLVEALAVQPHQEMY